MALAAYLIDQRANLVLAKQVGNLSRREDVVNVLHEGLVLDLRVIEKEGGGLVLATAELVQLFEVLSELSDAVVLRDLDGETLLICNIGCKPCQALAA